MDSWDALLAYVGTALMGAVLAGLVARRRLARLPSWTVYLAGLCVWQSLVTCRPRLHTLLTWAVLEAFAVLATLWIALELAFRIAGRLPGVRPVLSLWLLSILAATAAFVYWAPFASGDESWARVLVLSLLPRLNVGIALCYCAVAAAAALYAVPLDHVHRAVLLGLMVYILVFVVALDRLNVSWLDRVWVSRANALSYTVLLSIWVAVAWRRQDTLEPMPEALKRRWWPWAALD